MLLSGVDFQSMPREGGFIMGIVTSWLSQKRETVIATSSKGVPELDFAGWHMIGTPSDFTLYVPDACVNIILY